jgi:hypothetical protein
MPGQIRDDQPHRHRIARAPPGPANELNRAAHDDRALGPIAADELKTITGTHTASLNESGGNSAAAGDGEDIVNPEQEPIRRVVAHTSILT